MDNLAHTLAGAALGEAGLKEKTGLAMPTLMIAANLPDIDVIGLFFGANLDWRRGWTHGPIALLVLPPLLALAMIAFDRWQARRGKRSDKRLPVRWGWLLALAYIGTLSHPLLDFLNTYGIRLLMPFSERWFYGDTLFIIDLWVWAALGLGVWVSRRRRKKAQPHPSLPAIAALAAVTLYISGMATAARAAERIAAREVEATGIGAAEMMLASPQPINPFRRDLVFRVGDAYGFGSFYWTPAPKVEIHTWPVPINMDDPAIAKAARHDRVASFLYWSRLPYATVERSGGNARVTIRDARYRDVTRNAGFVVSVVVPDRAAAYP